MTSRLEKDLLDNALILSAKNNKLHDVKKYLAQGASIHAEDKGGNNALILAAINGNQEMAAFLIANGINKNHRNHAGNTALIQAVSVWQPEMVQALLSWKVNVDMRNNQGHAAISYAVADPLILDSLLKAGANKDVQDGAGKTPLMLAVESGKTESVNILLKAGVNLGLRSMKGYTVLVYAVTCTFWSPERDLILRTLVEAGAELRVEDNKGLTEIDHAANHGLKDVEKYLKERALEKELSVYKKGLSHPMKAPRPLRFN